MFAGQKIAVIIPAYNEEAALPHALAAIPEYVDRVIVADNGSTDGTWAIANNTNKYPKVTAVQEHRRGYGSACLAAMTRLTDEDIVVFLDADLSDDPALMTKLLDPIVHGADFVVSNRFAGLAANAMTLPQRFGNQLAVWLIRLFWGFQYFDLGPFRAIRRRSLDALKMRDKDYGWTIEMQVKALRAGLVIAQADVSYRPRILGKSKVSGTLCGVFGAGTRIIGRILVYKGEDIWGRCRGAGG